MRLDSMPGSSPHRIIDVKWAIPPSDMYKSLNFCQSGRIANVCITASVLALSLRRHSLMLCFWKWDSKCHVAISVLFLNFLRMSFLILIFFFFILITGNLIKELSDILNLSCSGNYYPLMQRSLMLPLHFFFFVHSPCPCQTLPWSEPILTQNDEPEGSRGSPLVQKCMVLIDSSLGT